MFKIKIVNIKSHKIEDTFIIDELEIANDIAYDICLKLTNKKKELYDYYVEEI